MVKTKTKRYKRKAFGERPPYLKTLRMYLPMYTWRKERGTIVVDGLTIKTLWRGTSKGGQAKNVIIYQHKSGHYYVRSHPDGGSIEWQKWANMKGVGKLMRPPQVVAPQQEEMQLEPPQLAITPETIQKARTQPMEKRNKMQCNAELEELKGKVADLKERNRELQATLAQCFVWIQEKSEDVKLLQEVKSCIQR